MRLRQLVLGLVAATLLLQAPAWAGGDAGSAAPGRSSAPAAPTGFDREVLPFLSKHCFACHGNGKSRGDLSLDRYRDERAVERDRKVWENVIEMVRSGEMPPKKRPRPPEAETQAVLQTIDTILNKLDCDRPRNVGRVTLRRLNRNEYNNTIRDLVGIDFKPASSFPNDDVGYGFDNIGDVLSLSPLLLEKYLIAAESILEQAIVIADPPKPVRSRVGSIRTSFGAGGERRGVGLYLQSSGSFRAQSFFEAGDYIFRVRTFAEQAGGEPVRASLRVNSDLVQEFVVDGTQDNPTQIEARLPMKSGTARISVSFLNPSPSSSTGRGSDGPEAKGNAPEKKRLLWLRGIEVEGPFDPPAPELPESHRRIMTHDEGLAPREAARAIVVRFATRAFRRPLKPGEDERLLKLYDQADAAGERFENAVRLALEGVLIRPDFLFRVELDPPGVAPGTSYPVSEYELASRLSYFLWSSMPDDALFALAGQGKLRQNLDSEVRRMLKDPKSAAFVANFAGQWLTLRKLDYVAPDTREFPGFDQELRAAMARETELFFEAILREDRSILDLLDADFSFVNERLARHYGIEGVKGKEFRRVKLPPNRGGILTQASILTLTSNPTRTSPVKRGKWVLDQILNTPPPPPPPDVPDLAEEKRLTGSLRKVMELHREQPLCASCHQRMDPIGFAFENYDAVGAWRDKDGEFPIDPSGVLPGGQSFQGPAELKTILRGKKDVFSRCVAEKLLTYALGRGLESYDKCAVDTILAGLKQNDYRFSSLLAEVVRSEPFQMRTATGDEP